VAVAVDGLAYGEFDTFKAHMIALVVVSGFAFGMSYLLLFITDKILPLRVTEDDERSGLDVSQHDESLVEAVV